MKMIDNFKKKVYDFVMGGKPMEVKEDKNTDMYNEQIENKIWYNGNSRLLSDYYGQYSADNDIKYNYFWSKSYTNMNMRKIHGGLPAQMVDKLVQITLRDGYEVSVEEVNSDIKVKRADKVNSKVQVKLENIFTDNGFEALIKTAVTSSLVNPRGAFKLSSDADVTDYPIIEYVEATNVELVKRRNRLFEVKFKNYYTKGNKKYCLYENYGKGYIQAELYEVKQNELNPVGLDAIEEAKEYAQYENGIKPLEHDFIYAIPVEIYEDSLFDKKKDIFDGIDEVLSIMGGAVRSSVIKQYIPENMLPRSTRTGEILKPDGFDDTYILTADTGSEKPNKIETVQPDIDLNAYEGTLKNYIYQALLGILSPSTLGLDMAGKDNAEAQREREKTSIFTRTDIIRTLEAIIKEVAIKVLIMDGAINENLLETNEVCVEFGEYASISFEDKVDTMAKAKEILPASVIIDELYGDSKSDEEKALIVEELNKTNINVDFNDMLPKE